MFNKIRFIVLLACIYISHAAYAVPVSDVMEVHDIPNVGSTPFTINLDNVYSDAIPVCTYNLPSVAARPAVVRINSIGSTSISIELGLLDDTPGATVTPGNVHCVIVQEGLHDINGTPIEARKVLSDGIVGRFTSPPWTTGSNNGWTNSLEDISNLITHPFTNPVVLGQVITSHDPLPSIYYANNCSTNRRTIPFADNRGICVGRHISKELGTRADEYIGVIIAGATESTGASGSTGGFRAGTTGTTISGVGASPPYFQNTVNSYSVGILSQLAERGGDGGWAVLYGNDPLANNQISMAIEESLINSNNRWHVPERVNYLVVAVPTITLKKTVIGGGPNTQSDFNLSFSGSVTNIGIEGSPNVTNFPVQPGTYKLSENTLAQYNQTDLSCSGGTLTGDELQLTAFDNATCTFTNTYDASAPSGVPVSGTVFEDLNSNGNLNGSEDWTNGVSVYVNIMDPLNPTTVLQSVQVNSGSGDFTFDSVLKDTYEIILTDSPINSSPVAPPGWTFTKPSDGTLTAKVNGSKKLRQNFGLTFEPQEPESDLSITHTIDKLTPFPGETVALKLTVNNAGVDVANEVVIENRLPSGFNYLSSSIITSNNDETTTPCVHDNGVVTCKLNSIDPNIDEVIGLVAFANQASAGTTQTNVVEIISAVESDPDSEHGNNVLAEDDQQSIDIAVQGIPEADLSLSKTVNINQTTVLQDVIYTIVVSNAGPAEAINVAIVDTLPVGLSFVSASVSGGDAVGECGLFGQELTCKLGSITATSPKTVTITATVQADQGGKTLTNSVEVIAVDNPDPDSIMNNGVTTEDDYAAVDITIAPQGFTIAGRVFHDADVTGSFTANDSGISGISVVLFDAAAGTCISTQTDGAGLYNFALVADGKYTVYESAYESLPVPTSCPPTAQDPGDHLSVTSNSIGVLVDGADVEGLDFADVQEPSLLEQHVANVEPGLSVVYTHRFITQTDAEVAFGVSDSSTPQSNGWSSVLYLDRACDAQLGSDDTPFNGSLTLNAGDSVCLITKVTAPPAVASGVRHLATLSAKYKYADPTSIEHGLTNFQQRTDITTTTAAAVGRLVLAKFVENLSEGGAQVLSNQADSSDILRYTVKFENTGAGGVSDLKINDATPAFTTLATAVTCPAVVPQGLSNCTVQVPSPAMNSAGYSGPIEWRFVGRMLSGAQGELNFDVSVD